MNIVSKIKDVKAIKAVANFATKHASKATFVAKKHAPEALLVVGVICVCVGTGVAVKETLKAPEVVEESTKEIEAVKEQREAQHETVYPQIEYRKDIARAYFHAGRRFFRLYAPAIGIEVFGIVCIMSSHNILKKRNIALIGAVKALDESFSKYRSRVADRFGEEVEKRILAGANEEEAEYEETVVDENGNERKETRKLRTVVHDDPSIYARMFDETMAGRGTWRNDPYYNMQFLRLAERNFNELLQVRGFVILNEVYKELGYEPTSIGQIVGWLKDPEEGKGDGYISFGIFDKLGNYLPQSEFMNGMNPAVLLDFNVDGVIYDKIDFLRNTKA